MDNQQNTPFDYSRYTIAELEDVLANIDRDKYAQRYADAKAMLETRLKNRQLNSASNLAHLNEPIKPKWSEMHVVTRIMSVAFLFLIFAVIPTMFSEFMAAKSWLAHTNIWIWALGGVLSVLWFTSLIKDENFARYLTRNMSGKFAAVLMPFLFLMFSFMTIDITTPLFLHKLSEPKEVIYVMQYHKESGSKHCRYKVEIVETKELQRGKLCMSESMRNSLPESGQILVTGTRSQFGMVVKGFKPLR
uniref:Uncharacterized protein n=1 Tax=Rheinheimera sp. BAL341 TaxID=1708203 RepID=A0A486XPQ9_9GAMM